MSFFLARKNRHSSIRLCVGFLRAAEFLCDLQGVQFRYGLPWYTKGCSSRRSFFPQPEEQIFLGQRPVSCMGALAVLLLEGRGGGGSNVGVIGSDRVSVIVGHHLAGGGFEEMPSSVWPLPQGSHVNAVAGRHVNAPMLW